MPPLESPLTGDQQPRLKSGRKPLQPKNSLTESEIQISKPTRIGNENKENNQHHSYQQQQQQQPLICSTPPASKLAELTDSSLADELTAMRKRMESLRLDAEKTEQMLKERGKALDLQMKTLEARGVAQIMLELEVDRLYRFKELHSYSMQKISPVRSLRDKEQEKLSHAEVTVMEDGSSRLQGGNESPCCSSSSSNSNPTQPAAVVAQ
ncbi:hypothetical protein LINPERHAP1_LOCUS12081 [Linum perenne]